MGISEAYKKRINELVYLNIDCKIAELHKLMHVDYRALSNSLYYGIIPSVRTLCLIADYFDVSLNYLLGQNEDVDFRKASVESNFNERFTALCREKGVTYYKVSSECRFDKSYISRWLNKNLLPSIKLLKILADYFNVSIDYLLGRTKIK